MVQLKGRRHITFITQGVEEIVASPIGPAILNNTATKIILLQRGDISVLKNALSEAKILQVQDQSVAESIAMNGKLYKVADQADFESQRILEHAQMVNPQGAAKLTAQSLAVLIGVTTQVLRTNSMMLKLMGQNLAATNRTGKLQAEQFQKQYQGLGKGFRSTKDQSSLHGLKD